MTCPNTNGCPLFPVFTMKAALKVWQDFYCNKNYGDCARYKMAQEGVRVPPNLLPNGKNLNL